MIVHRKHYNFWGQPWTLPLAHFVTDTNSDKIYTFPESDPYTEWWGGKGHVSWMDPPPFPLPASQGAESFEMVTEISYGLHDSEVSPGDSASQVMAAEQIRERGIEPTPEMVDAVVRELMIRMNENQKNGSDKKIDEPKGPPDRVDNEVKSTERHAVPLLESYQPPPPASAPGQDMTEIPADDIDPAALGQLSVEADDKARKAAAEAAAKEKQDQHVSLEEEPNSDLELMEVRDAKPEAKSKQAVKSKPTPIEPPSAKPESSMPPPKRKPFAGKPQNGQVSKVDAKLSPREDVKLSPRAELRKARPKKAILRAVSAETVLTPKDTRPMLERIVCPRESRNPRRPDASPETIYVQREDLPLQRPRDKKAEQVRPPQSPPPKPPSTTAKADAATSPAPATQKVRIDIDVKHVKDGGRKVKYRSASHDTEDSDREKAIRRRSTRSRDRDRERTRDRDRDEDRSRDRDRDEDRSRDRSSGRSKGGRDESMGSERSRSRSSHHSSRSSRSESRSSRGSSYTSHSRRDQRGMASSRSHSAYSDAQSMRSRNSSVGRSQSRGGSVAPRGYQKRWQPRNSDVWWNSNTDWYQNQGPWGHRPGYKKLWNEHEGEYYYEPDHSSTAYVSAKTKKRFAAGEFTAEEQDPGDAKSSLPLWSREGGAEYGYFHEMMFNIPVAPTHGSLMPEYEGSSKVALYLSTTLETENGMIGTSLEDAKNNPNRKVRKGINVNPVMPNFDPQWWYGNLERLSGDPPSYGETRYPKIGMGYPKALGWKEGPTKRAKQIAFLMAHSLDDQFPNTRLESIRSQGIYNLHASYQFWKYGFSDALHVMAHPDSRMVSRLNLLEKLCKACAESDTIRKQHLTDLNDRIVYPKWVKSKQEFNKLLGQVNDEGASSLSQHVTARFLSTGVTAEAVVIKNESKDSSTKDANSTDYVFAGTFVPIACEQTKKEFLAAVSSQEDKEGWKNFFDDAMKSRISQWCKNAKVTGLFFGFGVIVSPDVPPVWTWTPGNWFSGYEDVRHGSEELWNWASRVCRPFNTFLNVKGRREYQGDTMSILENGDTYEMLALRSPLPAGLIPTGEWLMRALEQMSLGVVQMDTKMDLERYGPFWVPLLIEAERELEPGRDRRRVIRMLVPPFGVPEAQRKFLPNCIKWHNGRHPYFGEAIPGKRFTLADGESMRQVISVRTLPSSDLKLSSKITGSTKVHMREEDLKGAPSLQELLEVVHPNWAPTLAGGSNIVANVKAFKCRQAIIRMSGVINHGAMKHDELMELQRKYQKCVDAWHLRHSYLLHLSKDLPQNVDMVPEELREAYEACKKVDQFDIRTQRLVVPQDFSGVPGITFPCDTVPVIAGNYSQRATSQDVDLDDLFKTTHEAQQHLAKLQTNFEDDVRSHHAYRVKFPFRDPAKWGSGGSAARAEAAKKR